MASEVIKLNIIPTGEMPVFHCSQFDNGRLINIELYRGEDAYTIPEGCTAELHCRKVDGKIVTLGSPVVDENIIKFTSTTQLTACNGKNLCEVAILGADNYLIGSLNFWLEVELDPLKGGINSTSEIYNLQEQIEDITEEVIGDNYYDKTEVDTLLADKADVSSVYTKTETDAKLALKANASSVYTKSETDTLLSAKADASNVYTKGETDTLLDTKVNTFQLDSGIPLGDVFAAQVEQAYDSDIGFYDKVSNRTLDVYTKTQVDTALALKANAADVYTKTQVDNIILDIMPVDTASGATAEFNTQIAVPLVSVITYVTSSGGGGTPDSPVPIVGKSQAVITANGNDVTIAFGQTVYGGVLDVTRGKLTVTTAWLDLSDLSYSYNTTAGVAPYFFASISGVKYEGPFFSTVYNSKCNIYTCTKRDGPAFVDKTYCFDGSALTVSQIQIKDLDYTDPVTFKASLSGAYIIYELATPFDIDLTPEVISAIVGANNVSSDTGNIEVKYKTTIQDYIDSHTGG